MGKSYKIIGLVILTALLGGGVSVASKIGLQDISPIAYTLIRFILGGLILLPILFKNRRPLSKTKLKSLIFVAILGTMNIMFFIFAIVKTTADSSAMLYVATPLITGIFSYFILKEKIAGKKLLGIIVGFVGVMTIILLPIIGTQTVFTGNLGANVLILIAVCSTALSAVLAKKLQNDYNAVEIVMVFIALTIIINAILTPWDLSQHPGWLSALSLKSTIAVIYTGILGTGVYYFLFQRIIQKTTPIAASMVLYLQPIFTFFWAAILLGERMTSGFIIGTVITFVGVALVTTTESPATTL